MTSFSIFLKKNSDQKVEKIIALKDGFSWSAFFFSGLWFLYWRMWREFLVLFLVEIVIASVEKFSSNFDQFFLATSFAIIVAVNANYWLADYLKRRGHQFVGVVFAKNSAEAKVRFIENSKADIEARELDFADSFLDPTICEKKLKQPKRFFFGA